MIEVALGDEVPQLEAVALAEGMVDDDELYLHLLGRMSFLFPYVASGKSSCLISLMWRKAKQL